MRPRTGWVGALAALVACAEGPSTSSLPASQAPPPAALTAGAAAAGQRLVAVVDGFPAGAQVHLVGSTASAGAPICPAPLAPSCLDLLGPAAFRVSAVADAQGHAEFEVPLPAGLGGRTLQLQAASGAGGGTLTGALSRLVHELPCRRAMPLVEDFNSAQLGVHWRVVDQGSVSQAASWQITGGEARETGNANSPPEYGTWLQPTVVSYGRGELSATVYAGDDDQIGLQYGVRSVQDYFRVDLDVADAHLGLWRVAGGTFTQLAAVTGFGAPHQRSYELTVRYDGLRHVVLVDGEVALEHELPLCLEGGIGLFARQMSDARFEEVRMRGPRPSCGDGALQVGEACDDGNLLSGDGCDMLCEFSEEGARDHDGDGLLDYVEVTLGTSPYGWDTDGDGQPDGVP